MRVERNPSAFLMCVQAKSVQTLLKSIVPEKKKILQDNQLMERVHIHKHPVTADAKT